MANEQKKAGMTQDETRIQQIALSVAAQITSKDGTTFNSDGKPEKSYREVEYVALIYRNGGELKATGIHTDNNTSQTSLNKAIAEAGGANNVVAVVHNHPEAHVKITQATGHVSYETARAANRLPSEADWAVAKNELFGKDKDKGRPEDKEGTLFIIAPQGKLRAYDYEDKGK